MVVDQWVKRSGDPQFKSSQPQNTPSVNCAELRKIGPRYWRSEAMT